jgi:hypothetical protein
MVSIPKVIGVLACGVVLSLGLSNAASGAGDINAAPLIGKAVKPV